MKNKQNVASAEQTNDSVADSKVLNFIKTIRKEKKGFSFGEPWRLDEKSVGVVIPITRKTDKEREYIMLAEAKQIEIKDTGMIDSVSVTNNESKPILISRGEIFRGKSQERAAIHDHIVEPGKGINVTVRCIHASKGINAGEKMEYGGRTAYGISFADQGKTWDTVTAFSAGVYGDVGAPGPAGPAGSAGVNGNNMSFTSNNAGDTANYILGASRSFNKSQPLDNYVKSFDDMAENLREIMKKIPFVKNQVGGAFFQENELIGLDIYDLPDSWDSVKKDVIEKEGSSFVKKDSDNMFEWKPKKAHKLLKRRLDTPFKEKQIYSNGYKIVEIKSDDLIGEAVVYGNDVLHLTMWKKI